MWYKASISTFRPDISIHHFHWDERSYTDRHCMLAWKIHPQKPIFNFTPCKEGIKVVRRECRCSLRRHALMYAPHLAARYPFNFQANVGAVCGNFYSHKIRESQTNCSSETDASYYLRHTMRDSFNRNTIP